MIITAVFVHAVVTGSVEFGVGTIMWAIPTFIADCTIGVCLSNG